MCSKPVLHYFEGRGRMETVRWLLGALGVEFEEKFIYAKEDYNTLLEHGDLLFQQVPMVEIDCLKLVSVHAILGYIARKYNIYGKNIKEKAFIDMYVDATGDLMALVLMMPFQNEDQKKKQREQIKEKAEKRYFPVFEKALENEEYLVGKAFSLADVRLMEAILTVEEVHCNILQNFPNLQAFKARISQMPTIQKFLAPGSQRKPVADEKYVNTVTSVFSS